MIQRKIYQLLLCLHPASFRERFAEEMLWLFDQTIADKGSFELLADAACSLLKQHMAVDSAPRCKGRLFQSSPEDTLRAIRILQAGAVALPVLVGFFTLVEQSVPLPEPPRSFAVRSYRPDACSGPSVASRAARHRHRVR